MPITSEQHTEIRKELSDVFEKLIEKFGYTQEIKMAIVQYTMGYMGASKLLNKNPTF